MQVAGSEFCAQDGAGDADPVCGAGEGQDVELVSTAIAEWRILGDDADGGVRALGQGEQVAELADNGLGVLELELEVCFSR